MAARAFFSAREALQKHPKIDTAFFDWTLLHGSARKSRRAMSVTSARLMWTMVKEIDACGQPQGGSAWPSRRVSQELSVVSGKIDAISSPLRLLVRQAC
jgi:hypothetical protein